MGERAKGWQWAALYLAVTVFVRWLTFFKTSIDHDESTYLIIADQWLGGHLPFVDFMDVKPIGIYILFAGALKLFGSSILAVRLAACLAIAGTALLVRQILRNLKQAEVVSAIGGLIYILCISLHQWTWASNTELFFNFFTAAALAQFTSKDQRSGFFLAGFLLGLAFIIKYHVIFDFAAFGCAFLLSSRSATIVKIKGIFFSCLGCMLPFIVWIAIYFLMGYGDELKEVIINIPSRYSTSLSLLKRLSFFGEFYLVYLPVSALFFYTVYRRSRTPGRNFVRWLVILWPTFVWLAILLTGKPYFHYYIQQILPLCIIASLGLGAFLEYLERHQRLSKVVLALFVALFLAPPLLQYQALHTRQDVGLAASDYLNAHLQPGEDIFAAESHIVYFLCNRAPLTKYVHSSILSKPDLIEAFGLDRAHELGQIFSQEPRYCLARAVSDDPLLARFLEEYVEVERYRDNVILWERR